MIGCFIPNSRRRLTASPTSGVNIHRAIASGLAALIFAIWVSMLVAPCGTASVATIVPPLAFQNGSTARTTLSPASFFQCSTASRLAPMLLRCEAAATPRSAASERLWKMYFDTPTRLLDTPPPLSSRIRCWSASGAIAWVGAENDGMTACALEIVIRRFIADTASCALPDL